MISEHNIRKNLSVKSKTEITSIPSSTRDKNLKSFRSTNQIKLKMVRNSPAIFPVNLNFSDHLDSDFIPAFLLEESFVKEFKLLEIIGKGNQAEVYKIQNRITMEIQAAKIYNTKDEEKMLMIKKERDILARMKKNENIVQFKEFKEDQKLGNFILITEFIDGVSLDAFLLNNVVSLEDQHFIVSQIVKSLQYLHDNSIVHGDFNLKNILISPITLQIKIIDFGLSKNLDLEDCYEELLTPQGNHKYRAPKKDIFKNFFACDLWGLGLIVLSIFMMKKISTKKAVKLMGTDEIKMNFNEEIAKMVEILKFLKETKIDSEVMVVALNIQKSF